jgi:hypothetical protein
MLTALGTKVAIHPPWNTRSEKWIFDANLFLRLVWVVPNAVPMMNAVRKHQITAIAGVALLVDVIVTVSEKNGRLL